MVKKKCQKQETEEIEVPIQDISLEQFEELIENGCFKDELPFDFLADCYPEVLVDWYPGYPVEPRDPREADPFPCRALVKEGKLIINESEELDFPKGDEIPSEGEYDVFIQKTDDMHRIHLFPRGSCVLIALLHSTEEEVDALFQELESSK